MTDSTLVKVDVSVPPYKNGTYSDGSHKFCDRDTLNRYQLADQSDLHYGGTVGDGWTIIQGSFHPGYPGSAGTHDDSGVNDLNAVYQPGPKMLALAKVSCIYFYRTPADGFSTHGHTVSAGNPNLEWLARTQVSSFHAGRNGLANNGPFRLPPGVSHIPTLEAWTDPWHGQKPTPPGEHWPAFTPWPGMDKTGWGEGKFSEYNLLASCALGIRGYVGGYNDVIDKTWDVPAMQALQRWQDNHQPWAGRGFVEAAWEALSRIPVIKHDRFNQTEIYEDGQYKFGTPSHVNYFAEMLLVLQGFSSELDQRAQLVCRPHLVGALESFQKEANLTVDGVLGPITWAALWETQK